MKIGSLYINYNSMEFYRYALMALAAIVLGGLTWWIARRPSRVASRLGMRGLKRQRALLDPMWAGIEPLIRWAGVRVSGILSDARRNKLDLSLTHAGDYLGLTVDEYFAMILFAGIIGGVLGGGLALYDSRLVVGIPAGVLVGAMIPHMMVDGARANRFCAINRGLPYAIDLMSLSMSAGLDFPGALHQVVTRSKANEALRDELGYILQQFQLGRTRAQVLNELSFRVPIEAVREFVHALLQAEERGSPVAATLEIQASTARIRRANLAENAAHDMKGRMVLPTMMIVGVSLMLIAVPSMMMLDSMAGGLGR
jgi:tight adherence protein C